MQVIPVHEETKSMRPGQQNNKRMRGRNRKGPNPMTRSFESNGGDVKIRGTALHVAEKYVQLARDASSSGDRVAAENYLQHAEHYYRILAAAQAQMPQPPPVMRGDDEGDGDGDDEGGDGFDVGMNGIGQPQPQPQNFGQYGNDQPGYGPGDPQPYVNGGNNNQEQPYEGQPMDNRGGDNRDRGNDNRDRGGFRGGRRRRPFRDRQGGERGGEDRQGGERGGDGGMGGGMQGQSSEPAPAAPTPTPAPVTEE
jgi:hypothetical protein